MPFIFPYVMKNFSFKFHVFFHKAYITIILLLLLFSSYGDFLVTKMTDISDQLPSAV